MSKVSPILRQTTAGFTHWCPACEDMHPLPDNWAFNGDVNKPTFTPSFNQLGVRDGKNCHYIITDGMIHFQQDSWHGRSDSVAMPNLP